MATTVSAHPSRTPVPRREHEHDLELIEGAIALVAAGGARRVALVLRHGALVLPAAQVSGRQCGVVVRPVSRTNGGCDIVVEPVA